MIKRRPPMRRNRLIKLIRPHSDRCCHRSVPTEPASRSAPHGPSDSRTDAWRSFAAGFGVGQNPQSLRFAFLFDVPHAIGGIVRSMLPGWHSYIAGYVLGLAPAPSHGSSSSNAAAYRLPAPGWRLPIRERERAPPPCVSRGIDDPFVPYRAYTMDQNHLAGSDRSRILHL